MHQHTRFLVFLFTLFVNIQSNASPEVLARITPTSCDNITLRAQLKDQSISLSDLDTDSPNGGVSAQAEQTGLGTQAVQSLASPLWLMTVVSEFMGTPINSDPDQAPEHEFPSYGAYVRQKVIEEEKDNQKKLRFQAHENRALIKGNPLQYVVYLAASKVVGDFACAGAQAGIKKATGDVTIAPVFAGTMYTVAVSAFTSLLFKDARFISGPEIASCAATDATYEMAEQGAKWLLRKYKKPVKLPIPQWLRDRGVDEKSLSSMAQWGIAEIATFYIKPKLIRPHTDALCNVQSHDDPPVYSACAAA